MARRFRHSATVGHNTCNTAQIRFAHRMVPLVPSASESPSLSFFLMQGNAAREAEEYSKKVQQERA